MDPSPEYAAIRKHLASGWNTWNTRSVLSHVLLPQGFALNLGIKEFRQGGYLKEALPGRPKHETVATAPHRLTAVPYYAWANRGMGEMAVWMAREPGRAWLPPSLPEPIARVTTSGGVEKVWTGYNDQNDALSAIHDGREPLSSSDASYRFFRMRPPKGERAWLVYEFEAPTELSYSRVYFYDDKRFCTLPDSWRLLYREGGVWRPVEARNPYRVELDDWSEVEFYPVTTTALRLEVEPSTVYWRGGASGPPAAMPIDEDVEWREFGLLEWQVGRIPVGEDNLRSLPS